MRVHYDDDDSVDILHFDTGAPSFGGYTLPDDGDVIVFVATEDGHDIAAVTVMAGSTYLPLGRGYDADTDTLMLGRTIDDPNKVTGNGDITVWWKLDEDFDDGFLNPIGVAIKNVSAHIANMKILSREPAVR